jgi:nitrogen fixation protein NifB
MNLDNHPCFNKSAHKSYGRVHLPVAPRCNVQCKFCNRKFDCVNESRPGVTSGILTPYQAMIYLDKVFAEKKNISVVGNAGPGDPFANPDETLETLKRVRETCPDMLLCLATNGLNLAPHVDALAKLKVSHVTVTVNAVDPAAG